MWYFFHVGLCGTITFEFWSYHYRCVRVRQYQSVAAARERATDYTLHFKLLLLCPRRVRSIAMCVSVCMSALERTVFQKKTKRPNFAKFSVRDAYGHGSVYIVT